MGLTGGTLAVTTIVVVLFQMALLYIYWRLGSMFLTNNQTTEGRGDVVAVMYCCSHKSLTLGIPLLKIMYEGNPILSIISIPLLIYHPSQILLGSALVQSLQKWAGSIPTLTYEKLTS